jgi:uncharacterized membrane protein
MEARASSIEGTDLTRLVAFTDGVFAIAITLLVLNIEVPDVSDGKLAEELWDLAPQLLAYFLSFAVVGRFWLIHHRVFATMRSFDATLVSLNLLYLSLVVLIPFTTEVLGEYGDTSVGVIVYASVMGLVALVNWLMIRHVLSSGHVRAEARERTAGFGGRRALGIPAVFLLSMPVAIVHPYAAEAMWILLLVVVRRRMR